VEMILFIEEQDTHDHQQNIDHNHQKELNTVPEQANHQHNTALKDLALPDSDNAIESYDALLDDDDDYLVITEDYDEPIETEDSDGIEYTNRDDSGAPVVISNTVSEAINRGTEANVLSREAVPKNPLDDDDLEEELNSQVLHQPNLNILHSAT
jgi:hypothetical protein